MFVHNVIYKLGAIEPGYPPGYVLYRRELRIINDDVTHIFPMAPAPAGPAATRINKQEGRVTFDVAGYSASASGPSSGLA